MISKDKQYRTRDGREVRIYAVDGEEPYPVHVAVLGDNGWRSTKYCRDGRGYPNSDTSYDLIEVKPRIQREVWVNVYPKESVMCDLAHTTKAEADYAAAKGRIACVKLVIDVEEGHGLD